ncbi:MAG: NADH:ubiquinone reductase (Na(+)-transporting) subunit C [Calditrichaeota bacterium]|nr:NADH:ubiquinone reductase (Na(+)-transporting) subunit C [Calditrichota bacterium]
MHSNSYTIGFAAIVTIVCSLFLALASEALKPEQKKQEELYIKKIRLSVVGVEVPETLKDVDVLKLYDEKIKTVFIDETGAEVEAPQNVNAYDYEKELKRFGFSYTDVKDVSTLKSNPEYQKNHFKIPVYIRMENGQPQYYMIPLVGKGLWSTLYGLVSFEPDMNTVKGLAFYKQQETPGLGAEIERDWFKANFVGKTIFNENGDLASITVKKGDVDESVPNEKAHMVDGISGATITSSGVTKLLKKDLSLYEPYFKKNQEKNMESK